MCVKSGTMNQEAPNVWRKDVLMIEKMPARDICNVDETGLFFKFTSDKTLAFKGEHWSGGEEQ